MEIPKADPDRGEDGFFVWRFRTGLYANLGGYAEQLQRPLRHRILRQPLSLPPKLAGFDELGQTDVLPDKGFEDAIFASLGERPDRSGEAAVTVLWQRDQGKNQL